MNKNEAMEMMMKYDISVEDLAVMLSTMLPNHEQLEKKRAQCYEEMRNIETYSSRKSTAAKLLTGSSWDGAEYEFSEQTYKAYYEFISAMSEMLKDVEGGQVGSMFFIPTDESRGEYLRISVERTHGVEIGKGNSICQNIEDAQRLRQLHKTVEELRRTTKKLATVQSALETIGNLSELFGE